LSHRNALQISAITRVLLKHEDYIGAAIYVSLKLMLANSSTKGTFSSKEIITKYCMGKKERKIYIFKLTEPMKISKEYALGTTFFLSNIFKLIISFFLSNVS